jgi:hypothetical protein
MPKPAGKENKGAARARHRLSNQLMRFNWPLLMVALLSCVLSGGDYRDLSKVHTVYILGMSNGLDQFLANRLTNTGVLWVVLDPARADAIMTDRLDEGFWTWLNARYPLASKAPMPERKDDLRSKNMVGVTGSIRGTVFLVDPKSRLVLWSAYDQAKRASADELDGVAARVTKRLTSSLGAKK